MNRTSISVLTATALLALGPSPSPAQTVTAPPLAVEEAAETITGERVYNRIYFLASDGLRGRDTPSPGLEAAAAYIVSEYRGMGLEPAGEGGTYYQRYPFLRRELDRETVRVASRGPEGERALRLGEEFFLEGGTSGPVESAVVYIGSGDEATDPPDGLQGRIALATAPGSWGRDFFDLTGRQAEAAEAAGASAIVHVLDQRWERGQVAELARRLAQPTWILGDDPGFPRIFATRSGARQLLQGAAGAREILNRPERARRGSIPEIRMSLNADRRVLERGMPPNVVGMVPGTDPELRDEYIALSAHFDHVGVGEPMNGDSIYNGADDNASGTAVLMEVARALALLPGSEGPRRTVLFVHVSGEEKGLLGSRWYSDHPTVPLEDIVANINVDMVAGDQHRDTVVVIGKDYSSLGQLVEEVNARNPQLGLVASDDLWPEQRFFFRSDHFNFARKEIPSVFFFTGVHECYHQPCDTPDFADPDKAARIARLIFHTTLEIANREERPVWDREGLEEVRALTR